VDNESDVFERIPHVCVYIIEEYVKIFQIDVWLYPPIVPIIFVLHTDSYNINITGEPGKVKW
jgi:hypothetical protein